MTPLIRAKWEAYCGQPLNNWLVQRELSLPLEPERSADSDDYNAEVKVPWWERLFFKMYTGFDLQIIRECKLAHSPRFKQLRARSNILDKSQAQWHSHIACEQIQLKACFKDKTLESYLVDREFSVYITNLALLEEILKNHRITWCERKNTDPKSTEFQISDAHPVEDLFSWNIIPRLRHPDKTSEHKPQYDEATDTFRLVTWEESIFRKIFCITDAKQVTENWANTSLTKRLAKDKIRRQSDPQCKLLFAHNEMYEELLKKHHMRFTAYRLAAVVFLALAGIVFFCADAKGK